MFGVTTSDDYRPVTWMGRFPVDVTTILVALHVVVAILTCLVVAAGGGAVLNFMLFDSARVLGAGQIWRLATYAFVHSPSMLLWFAIEMYILTFLAVFANGFAYTNPRGGWEVPLMWGCLFFAIALRGGRCAG